MIELILVQRVVLVAEPLVGAVWLITGECVAAGVREAVIGNPPGITVIGNPPGIARECVTVAGVVVIAVDAVARSVADVHRTVKARSVANVHRTVKARCMTKVPARME